MLFLLLIVGACQKKEEIQQQKEETMNNTEEHYTFTLSDKVTRQKVSFKNRQMIGVGYISWNRN